MERGPISLNKIILFGLGWIVATSAAQTIHGGGATPPPNPTPPPGPIPSGTGGGDTSGGGSSAGSSGGGTGGGDFAPFPIGDPIHDESWNVYIPMSDGSVQFIGNIMDGPVCYNGQCWELVWVSEGSAPSVISVDQLLNQGAG